MNDPRPLTPLSVALQILSALAGLATITALVGGAMLWIRADALRLPADHTVSQLPERLLVTVGVHALVAPVLIGLAIALVIVLIDPLRPCDGQPRKRLWLLWAALLAGGVVVLYLGVEGLNLKFQLPMYAIGVLALVVLVLSARARQTRGRHVALITFVAFVVCGSSLALLRTAGRPLMEPVAVLLKDGRGMSGFHVASTDGHIYVATLSGEGDPLDAFADAPIDRVVEIPRDEVVRRATRNPTSIGTNAGGRDEAQTLLLDLRNRYDTRARPGTPSSSDPVGDFAPLVHLHSKERFWPMSVVSFLRNSTLYWRHDAKCATWRVADGAHVPARSRAPDKVTPKVDPARLGGFEGAEPYQHAPSLASCRNNKQPVVDAKGPVVTATQTSRPFQSGRRLPGLPLAEGFYLDAADGIRGGMGRRRKNGSQQFFSGVPTYFEQNGEGNRQRITYWLFYGYSLPPGPEVVLERFAHEGDWERLSVLIEPAEGSEWRPVSVRYHFHDEERDVPWHAVRLAADEEQDEETNEGMALSATHPVAYVAVNSHATYARAGRFEESKIIGGRAVSASDEAIACSECPQWRTWNLLRNAQRQAWYGFGGAWGVVGADGSRTGPLGPSERKSVSEPEPSLMKEKAERERNE